MHIHVTASNHPGKATVDTLRLTEIQLNLEDIIWEEQVFFNYIERTIF